MKIENINPGDYNYNLPVERIAQYPVQHRDMSNLLIYRNKLITKDTFRNITGYIPEGSLLIFNNTRVIRARILFAKDSGAVIEILCLEPLMPSGYESSLGSVQPVEWKCLVGNLKKWKSGILSTTFSYEGMLHRLNAEKIMQEGEALGIMFSWDCPGLTFGEVIEIAGHIPLPPYINRTDEPEDTERYQTVYSSVKGSVAAPTAGLHFTENVLKDLENRNLASGEITLHVGAGTFKPLKSKSISEHEMHTEHFTVTEKTVEKLISHAGSIIAVGTTSVRTLESLYWIGVKLTADNSFGNTKLTLGQWEPYKMKEGISFTDSMNAIISYLKYQGKEYLEASTGIMIVPGYKFKTINGIITNFHQPGSTLLLLVSAWTGNDWKKIYEYAFVNNFRFLSYGDSSLLMR